MNQHFEDSIQMPGYREWEAFELRSLLNRHGFSPESEGLWANEDLELLLVVTPTGLFVGWYDFHGAVPGDVARRLMTVQHIPRGFESEFIDEAFKVAGKGRRAASIQCRQCGEVRRPSEIDEGRICASCIDDNLRSVGITAIP